ncbi:nucleotidyl transferase AbiEii/AbiGii toxin family protein [Massilia arenosa]|uniref:Nucleotidyl transferase AbiEii/AbiGii toxin family protein n=1 Tax=Zemynaea arenosa TaxID=2561931 RepID=A0A4Y9SEM1_9BURK|nr:nucleotidyl transferase AbiEii/AbiGii toxin family protein [Massilia arenosa]TFW21578.1 nucleotidyl transferase AbiEii/AbiGii toxin family protein [Massilia arenosa]
MNEWEVLFGHALTLIDHVRREGTKHLYWTFGGGTVLMLRHHHRISKDIDIFVPDPQALGYVTPRLSAHAEALTTRYVETANFVKLFLPEGEIDFVASPNLTVDPYIEQVLLGRSVKVETSAEIIAKKFWHRGDRLTARDIFDFAMLAEREPAALAVAAPFLVRHRATILAQLDMPSELQKRQFEELATLDYALAYEAAITIVKSSLASIG